MKKYPHWSFQSGVRKAALELLLPFVGQAEGQHPGRVDAWNAAGITQPWASHSVSACLMLSPVQVTGKWGNTLVSPTKAELCSSTGSQEVDVLMPKKQHIFCMGQKTARTRSHPVSGPSSCGHLQQPVWSHGPSVQGAWNRFTMWTSVTLHPTETNSSHCGKKWPCQSSVTEERFIGPANKSSFLWM